ncbi:hypothetical protein TRVL_02361 [Trypanosoma vivax]|uniref:Uncharacterized protein n=1 Tax=Trypanosoma vivax (strain Y486) TaxID=1055687 RepID=G0U9X5_TRYVY|nr:hypothetical protein TRVL_02361 [Trypanosoma vivax]CCC52606.1 hypothetical protein TVY486_1100910 [Trypanosoma vivax Y486]
MRNAMKPEFLHIRGLQFVWGGGGVFGCGSSSMSLLAVLFGTLCLSRLSPPSSIFPSFLFSLCRLVFNPVVAQRGIWLGFRSGDGFTALHGCSFAIVFECVRVHFAPQLIVLQWNGGGLELPAATAVRLILMGGACISTTVLRNLKALRKVKQVAKRVGL